MGEEVGTMQLRVQGEQIQNDERKKRRKNEYKEKKKDKKRMRKENIYMSL
jgi:aspartate carbamoyltransferase catalytic subunit